MKVRTVKGVREFVLTEQELEDVRSCVSVCVWIRSEQLAHTGGVLHVEVDTRDLAAAYCRAQRDGGAALHKRMTELLGPSHVPPSWTPPNGDPPR